ncbi:MAG: antibiotic acetyltransferase [Paludibacter sp.]|nr:antibiotic acetyltransferase [Paludibacter sp.]
MKNVFIQESQIKENVLIFQNSFISQSQLLGYNKIGKNCSICDSVIGMYSYVTNESIVINTTIGKYCSIGIGFKVGLGVHPTNFISTSPIFYSNYGFSGFKLADKSYFDEFKKTIIGHDVWIGANVFINEGITVGNGAIIGTGAVVTHNIPDYAIVGGVPAKVIKYRHDTDIIAYLNEIEWWNNELAWIKDNIKTFQKPILDLADLKDLK